MIAASLSTGRAWLPAITRYGLAPVLGVAAATALPPHYWLLLLIPAFSGLLWMLERSSSKTEGFMIGWLFGVGHYLTSTAWIARSFSVDADRFGAFATPAILLLSASLAVFTGVAGFLFASLRPRQGAGSLLTLAALLSLMEGLRSVLFGGFPWNLIGYVWTATDQTIQIVSIIGIHGLGFVTVILSALPRLAFYTTRDGVARSLWPMVASIAGVTALWCFGAIRLMDITSSTVEGVKLRIVQGNIPQSLKWQPKEREQIVDRYLRLSSAEGVLKPTHIIWPESAVPVTFDAHERVPEKVVSFLAPDQTLITGVVRSETSVGEGQSRFKEALFNSVIAVDALARASAIYDKVHLVPFGEFMPLRWLIPFKKLTEGSTDFSPGQERFPLRVGRLPAFAPLICYEAIFPHHAGAMGERPEWLLNVTNDAWFGDSDGPYQHLQMSRVRAVEQGVPLVRAANTGISALVDPFGRIVEQLDLGIEGILDVELPKPVEGNTWFRVLGNVPVILIVMLTLAATYRSARRRRFDPRFSAAP